MFTSLVRAAAQKEFAQKAYLFHRGADCGRNRVYRLLGNAAMCQLNYHADNKPQCNRHMVIITQHFLQAIQTWNSG